MAANFELVIGGDLKGMQKALKDALTSVNKFEQDLKKFGDKAEDTLKKAGQGAAKSGKDFTNLSRVIQDLPFGFIAISNNLTQILPAAGAAGLAISGLVAAVTFAQTGFSNWTRGLGDNKKAIDAAKSSGAEYAATLDQVSRSMLQGSQDAQGELTTLKLLYNTYADNTQSLTTRKSAYDQLQKLYPSYFGNLKFEKEISEKTTSAYNNLATAILATARARAAGDQITKNTTRQLEDEQKIADLQKAKLKVDEKVNRLREIAKVDTGEYAQNRLADALNEQLGLQTQLRNLATDKLKLDEQNLRLVKNINTEQAKGGLLSGSLGAKPDKGEDLAKQKADLIRQLQEAKDMAWISGLENINELSSQPLELLGRRVAESTKKALETGATSMQAPEIKGDQLINPGTMASAGAIFKDAFAVDVLPQLTNTFESFFNDVLTKGEFSFKSLARSIESTLASIVSSQAANGIRGLFDKDFAEKEQSKGGLASILKKGSGVGLGAILGGFAPILAGIGVAAGIGSLFKKHKSPDLAPAAVSGMSQSYASAGNQTLTVIMKQQGRDLIATLNLNGFYMSRAQNVGG